MGKRRAVITSTQNPKVQQVRSLLRKAHTRRDSQAFVVEGVRLLEEALSAGWQVQLALHIEGVTDRGARAIQKMISTGIDVEQVSIHVMESLTATENSQGLLAVLQLKPLPLPRDPDLVVIADSLRDPGNLGTLMRTSVAAGVQALLLTPGSTDAFAPKVVRSAMGAHFHLPVHTMDWPQIINLLKNNPNPLTVYLAHNQLGTSLWETDFSRPCAFVIGGEAEGASAMAVEFSDDCVHSPMPGKTESLNAAIAAAILLFEVVRQRRN
jgi:TrmH family RNA methyltransferase